MRFYMALLSGAKCARAAKFHLIYCTSMPCFASSSFLKCFLTDNGSWALLYWHSIAISLRYLDLQQPACAWHWSISLPLHSNEGHKYPSQAQGKRVRWNTISCYASSLAVCDYRCRQRSLGTRLQDFHNRKRLPVVTHQEYKDPEACPQGTQEHIDKCCSMQYQL